MSTRAGHPWPTAAVWRWTRRDAASGRPEIDWDETAGHGTLRLRGDWRHKVLPTMPTLRAQPAPTAEAIGAGTELVVDGQALTGSDERLAPLLWPLLQAAVAAGRTVRLQSLPGAAQAMLGMAVEQARRAAPAQPGDGAATTSPTGPLSLALHRLGEQARAALRERVKTLGFIGAVLQAAAADVPGVARNSLRTGETLAQFEQAGPRSLPIVLLVSGLIGLILAYMGGAQLRLFGAQSFVAPLVAVGELREIAALAVGIVLAGRVGASYAAQLATMRGSEEIDALRAMGVDPVQHLVLPRLVALLLAAPLLTVMAAACGMAAGWAVAVGVHDVPAREYLTRSLDGMTLPHLLVGTFKGTLYGVLVGLAGCNQGLRAERSATGVGQATTRAVVQAIVWVTVAASLTTVLFEQLGW